MRQSDRRPYDVAVIGGGAAGLVAAIAAARNGARTIILEHMDRTGKKILSTGNGKCNYTNALQGIAYYRGENPAFVLPVLEQFGLSETLAFFEELGVYPKVKNGYYYPCSGQAASVREALCMETEYLGIPVWTSFSLTEIRQPDGTEENYVIAGTYSGGQQHPPKQKKPLPERQQEHSPKQKEPLPEQQHREIRAKTIIFATGLLAAQKTGSDGSAFPYIEALGHHFIDIVPALTPLQGKQSFFKTLAGIRAEMRLDLYIENEHITSEQGELQLTDYGISGIPVFQISRFASRALRQKKAVHVRIDFMPGLEKKELLALLERRFGINSHGKNAAGCMVGLFNRKLNEVFLQGAGIPAGMDPAQISYRKLAALAAQIKGFCVDICADRGTDQGQACAGGVSTAEIHNATLESRISPGVFFAGEVIDIDGACGGYNLQWAWSSGYVAGSSAAKQALFGE